MMLMEESSTMPSIWSEARRPRPVRAQPEEVSANTEAPLSDEGLTDLNPAEYRSVFQHDYDRLLFSTPVRRLADKPKCGRWTRMTGCARA